MSRGTVFSRTVHVCPAKTQMYLATAQSDHSLRCPPEDALDPWLPTECYAKTLIRLHGFAG